MTRRSKVTHDAPEHIAEAARMLGGHLRDARLARGLTMTEVGETLGITRFTVAAAERGRLGTSIGVYLSLMAGLELELDVQDALRHEPGRARRLKVARR